MRADRVEVDIISRHSSRARHTERFFIRCSVHGDVSPLYAHLKLAESGLFEHIVTLHPHDKGNWK